MRVALLLVALALGILGTHATPSPPSAAATEECSIDGACTEESTEASAEVEEAVDEAAAPQEAAEPAEAVEEEQAPPPPPPPRRSQSGIPGGKRGAPKQQPIVRMGQSLLSAVSKPLSSVGVPPQVAGAALVGLLGVAKLATGGGGGGGGARVNRALAAAVPEVEEEPVIESVGSSDDLWLDVQIDRFIAFLKMLITGKK